MIVWLVDVKYVKSSQMGHWNVLSRACCKGHRSDFELMDGKPTFHKRANLSWLSKICNHFGEIATRSQKSLTMIKQNWGIFWKKDPLRANFQKKYFERMYNVLEAHVVCKFREIWLTGNRQSRALFTWQKTKLPQGLLLLLLRGSCCQGQPQTIYSKFPKFHPNHSLPAEL